ncbi:MAG TPA: iron-sulfur cluster assembly protein, partial [Gammaproteobacteria bacterium]
MFFRNKDKPAEQQASETVAIAPDASLKERVIAAIRTVYDPEISVNIYDLGLIY